MHTQAALSTAKLFVGAAAVSTAVMLILNYVPIMWVCIGMVTVCLGFLMKSYYEFEKDRIEIVKKISKKY